MTSTPARPAAAPVILFAGGGTGGHLTPALAVADRLRELAPQVRVAFASSDRAIDRRLLPATDRCVLPLQPLASALRHPLQFLRSLHGTWRVVRELMSELQPTVVVGVGGLASLPVLVAGRRRGCATVLLEQNAIPGRANRQAARFATAACVSFPPQPKQWPARLRVINTGNPMRAGVAQLADRPLPRAGERRTVLVLGGSQGARALNLALIRLLANPDPVLRQFDWLHQTGAQLSDEVRQAYARAGLTAEVAPFFNPLHPHLERATLAVTRGGATTLAELACAGVPALILPYPDATDNHQVANAQHYVSAHAALAVPQGKSPQQWEPRLTAHLVRLLSNEPERLKLAQAMRALARPAADTAVCQLLLELARVPQGPRSR